MTDKCKLFVSNLSWDTDDASLRRAFGKYGKVDEARVVNDRETGRSRGFGFVTFERAQDAQLALALDGTSLDGRSIRVREAEDKPPPRRQGERPRRERDRDSW